MGTGERSEKIRTYNFKENRVTDHRLNVSIYQLTSMLEGNIDALIEPLITWGQEQKLAASTGTANESAPLVSAKK